MTEKVEADKKATVAERMEQAYELIKEGTNTVGQMAAKMGVKKAAFQYYLKKLLEAGRDRNEDYFWYVSEEQSEAV